MQRSEGFKTIALITKGPGLYDAGRIVFTEGPFNNAILMSALCRAHNKKGRIILILPG